MADVQTSAAATGKRKTAIAQVRLRLGTGQFLVNGRTLEEHIPRDGPLLIVVNHHLLLLPQSVQFVNAINLGDYCLQILPHTSMDHRCIIA